MGWSRRGEEGKGYVGRAINRWKISRRRKGLSIVTWGVRQKIATLRVDAERNRGRRMVGADGKGNFASSQLALIGERAEKTW